MNESDLEVEKILGSLDDPLNARELAVRAAYSSAQFYRLVRKSLSGSPMALRRRLLLERAAWNLTRTDRAVTEIAFDAAFGSLEGFSRAFRRAYGASPSEYRRLGPSDFRLNVSQRIHFAPVGPCGQGENAMNYVDRMIEHHCYCVGQCLDACASMTDEELDRLSHDDRPLPWFDGAVSLRVLLGRTCAFAAPWIEAINGIQTDYSPSDVGEMRSATQASRVAFTEIVRAVERDKSWNLTFVDSVCEPPEVFSYGGVISHVLTMNVVRRSALLRELSHRGIEGLGYGDPMHFNATTSTGGRL